MASSLQDTKVKKANETGSCVGREVFVARKLTSTIRHITQNHMGFVCNPPIKKKSVTG